MPWKKFMQKKQGVKSCRLTFAVGVTTMKFLRHICTQGGILFGTGTLVLFAVISTKTGLLWILIMEETVLSQSPEISQAVEKPQDLWTLEKRRDYARRNDDPSKWDLKLLQLDQKKVAERDPKAVQSGISDYPSPVAAYDWGYGMIRPFRVKVGERTLAGVSVGYAICKHHPEPNAVAGDFYTTRFNLLVLTNRFEDSANEIVSRNYPHYMATGAQLTSQGKIDWVQIATADGRNLAIISQRVFDLDFGKTIVAIPHDDGSLRFLQLEETTTAFPEDIFGQVSQGRIETFFNDLRRNNRLIKAIQETDDRPVKK
jgi:hypothetical protein